MTYDFGDVLVVEFPFTDGSARKRRPAVVVSSRAYNAVRPDIVMVAITSQIRDSQDGFDIALRDWSEAGLQKPSALKPVIFTLENGHVRRRLGSLGSGDVASLRPFLQTILG